MLWQLSKLIHPSTHINAAGRTHHQASKHSRGVRFDSLFVSVQTRPYLKGFFCQMFLCPHRPVSGLGKARDSTQARQTFNPQHHPQLKDTQTTSGHTTFSLLPVCSLTHKRSLVLILTVFFQLVNTSWFNSNTGISLPFPPPNTRVGSLSLWCFSQKTSTY